MWRRSAAAQVALRAKRRGIYRETTWPELLEQVDRIGPRPDRARRRSAATALRSSAIRRRNGCSRISPRSASAPSATGSIRPVRATRRSTCCAMRGASVLIAEDQEHVDKVLPMLDRLAGLAQACGDRRQQHVQHRHPALMSLRGVDRAWRATAAGRLRPARARRCGRTIPRRSSTPPAPAPIRRARSIPTAR